MYFDGIIPNFLSSRIYLEDLLSTAYLLWLFFLKVIFYSNISGDSIQNWSRFDILVCNISKDSFFFGFIRFYVFFLNKPILVWLFSFLISEIGKSSSSFISISISDYYIKIFSVSMADV